MIVNLTRNNEIFYRPKHNDDDDVNYRIKLEVPTIKYIHDPNFFSYWLTNMDYYFEWNDIPEEHKIRLLGK